MTVDVLERMDELEAEAKFAPNKQMTYEVLWNTLKKELQKK